MRELNLYQTESDELVLIGEAIDRHCWLVADTHSESPLVHKLITLEDFQCARLETRHFFIFDGAAEGSRLSIRKVSKDGDDFYYVSPGVGIPSLEFLGGGVFSNSDTHHRLIRPGFLSYSPEYWTADLLRKLPSPPELASLFDDLCRTVKQHSSKIRPGKKVFWIGQNAQTELKNSARLVGFENLEPEEWFGNVRGSGS